MAGEIRKEEEMLENGKIFIIYSKFELINYLLTAEEYSKMI
jgi:hypothetical protein